MVTRIARIFTQSSPGEARRISEILRTETFGGILLILSAVVAVTLANSHFSEWYFSLRETRVDLSALHLNLSLEGWATDGLLAIFFFLVGIELKREFVAGDLRNPARAVVPVAAAMAGMATPAAIFLLVVKASDPTHSMGWAIPAATDIAFALAVLAVTGSFLPAALRTFLLTLAVVDDLLAVVVIAIFYSSDIRLDRLALAAIPALLFAVMARQRRLHPALLAAPFAGTWFLVHEAGVHATIAGAVLGFLVPLASVSSDSREDIAEKIEHVLRPISTLMVVPIFAFFSAGVALGGWPGLQGALSEPVAIGVLLGLTLGKPLGIFTSTFLLSKFTRAELDPSLHWSDVLGVSMLAGVGFTVSLLISKLAFSAEPQTLDVAIVGVFTGTLASAMFAAVVLTARNRRYRRQSDSILDN